METHGLRLTFRKRERLKLRRDFSLLFKYGRALQNELFVLIYRKNGLDHSRIAISVKRKFGKANRRNKIRRWVRECFRTRKAEFPKGYDLLFIVRKTASEKYKTLSFQDVCANVLALCARLRDEKNSAKDD